MARWQVKHAIVATKSGGFVLRAGVALVCVFSSGMGAYAQSSAGTATETVRLNLEAQQDGRRHGNARVQGRQ